jgi:hypothetical protein
MDPSQPPLSQYRQALLSTQNTVFDNQVAPRQNWSQHQLRGPPGRGYQGFLQPPPHPLPIVPGLPTGSSATLGNLAMNPVPDLCEMRAMFGGREIGAQVPTLEVQPTGNLAIGAASL